MTENTPHPDPPPQGGKDQTRPGSGKKCPQCDSQSFEVISLFGSQVMTMQCHCRKCGNYFEASKY